MCVDFYVGIMATFDLFDVDYGDLFLTQSGSNDACVSLEEDSIRMEQFQAVKDPQYSDICDFEDNQFDDKLR